MTSQVRPANGQRTSASGERHRLPILAINASGDVMKANAPAKRALDGSQAGIEGLNLSSIFVRLLGNRNSPTTRTSLSFLNSEGEREDVLVVLGNGQAASQPQRVATLQEGQSAENAGAIVDFIAHELRNPLGTILGLSEILESRGDFLADEDRRIAFETLHAEAEKALLIVEALLRLADSKAKAPALGASIPLHAVAHRVIAGHQRRNPRRVIKLSGDSPLFARGNALWVELALSNLLNNAEKYTPTDRPIELSFRQNGSRVTIVVLDNGDGLPADRYSGLWDLYAKGPNSRSLGGGFGIGLALCKQLIEGMGGQVWAGPRPAGGSAFVVSLPCPWDASVPAPLETRISDPAEYAISA